jgi:hypothetical protein
LLLSDHHPHCVALRRATSNSTASEVLDALKQEISAYGTSTVTTVGQSLGAALVHRQRLPPAAITRHDLCQLRRVRPASRRQSGVGGPRRRAACQIPAGNVVLTNNQKDPVPILATVALVPPPERGGTHPRVGRLGRVLWSG